MPRIARVFGVIVWILACSPGCAQIASDEPAEAGVPLQIIKNFPVIDVVIDGQTLPVAFDLGGDNTIELTATALEKIKVRYLQERYTWVDAKGHELQAERS